MTSHDQTAIAAAAEALYAARHERVPCAPVRTLFSSGDIAAAYATQQTNVRRLIAAGARPVGRKIGLTSVAVQRQLGVDRPDFGMLFDFMQTGDDGAPLALSTLVSPRIEAEIAFRMGRDVTVSNASRAELAAAIDGVAAAVEIVDSAIAGWDIDIVDTIADNASSGAFAVGPWQPFRADLDLPGRAMRLLRDAEEISRGSGAATLGDPLNALAWLAETAIEFGDCLRAGEIVLAGALGPMVKLTPGRYRAEIDGFPPLALNVVP